MIEVEGKKLKVVENLGYQQGMGGHAKVVLHEGKEYVVVKQAGKWCYRTPHDRVDMQSFITQQLNIQLLNQIEG